MTGCSFTPRIPFLLPSTTSLSLCSSTLPTPVSSTYLACQPQLFPWACAGRKSQSGFKLWGLGILTASLWPLPLSLKRHSRVGFHHLMCQYNFSVFLSFFFRRTL